MVMENVTRIGVSLEPALLTQFDDFIASKGYDTRSEAFRDLIRNALIQKELKTPGSRVVGTITIIYDHHMGNIKETLMELQHRKHQLISSSMHVHLDLDRCLEVLVVHGTVEQVKKLSDELTTVKGVLHGEPVLITNEFDHHTH